MTNSGSQRVLVLGGNFSGVYVALRLEALAARMPGLDATLVSVEHYLASSRPLHTNPARGHAREIDAGGRLRQQLRRVKWVEAEARSIDLSGRRVSVARPRERDPQELTYDLLVLATGGEEPFHLFANQNARALTLHSASDLMRLHTRVGAVLDHARREADPAQRRALLTFVVAGAGIDSAQTARALRALAQDTLDARYPSLRGEQVRVVLVHPQETDLPELGDRLLTDRQEGSLPRQVEVRLGERVRACVPGRVELEHGDSIPAFTLVWTGGADPGRLVGNLPCAKRGGRLLVDGGFALPGHPNVWAVGEGVLPAVVDAGVADGQPPLSALETLRQGRIVAGQLAAALRASPPPPPDRQARATRR